MRVDTDGAPEHGGAEIGRKVVRHACGGVAGDDVCHLVADHGRELILVFGHLKKARVDTDLAARQREGVDLFALEHPDFPPFTRSHRVRDSIGHATHVARDFRILACGVFCWSAAKAVAPICAICASDTKRNCERPVGEVAQATTIRAITVTAIRRMGPLQ